MTQLSRHPSYLLIEDQLDAIGQKWRVQRLARGAMLFACGAAASLVAATLAAHFIGQSNWTRVALGAWMGWLALSFVGWVVRPLLMRPRTTAVARLVEERLGDLHNGLTNSVQLAHAADLQQSPWLGAIFDEVLSTSRGKSLDQAVKISDLRPLAMRLLCVVAPLLALLAFPGIRSAMDHGWRQMFAGAAFVPNVGSVEILEIEPRSLTLVTGKGFEITIRARDTSGKQPQAKIIFENFRIGETLREPALDEGVLHYSYAVDRVEKPMRFRVEVGGTQTDWFSINVVRQVKLEKLALEIIPPAYTRQQRTTVAYKPEELDKAAPQAPEGSQVNLSADVDVPVAAALLQVDDGDPNRAPAAMAVESQGRRFAGSFILWRDIAATVLLKEGNQIIYRLPEQPMAMRATLDNPPQIEMKWPMQDVTVAIDQEIKLRAIVRDDYGVSAVRVLMATKADEPLAPIEEKRYDQTGVDFGSTLIVPQELRKHNASVRVQLEAMDNRRLPAASANAPEAGPQKMQSNIFKITFADAKEIARQEKEQADALRKLLMEMLKKQQDLHEPAKAWKPADKALMPTVARGQGELRQLMQDTATTFRFEADNKIIQKTLLMLAMNPAKEAVDYATAIQVEPAEKEQLKLHSELLARQRRIIDLLQSMLAMLSIQNQPTTKPTTREGADLPPDKREVFKNLKEDLDKFIKEEKRILDQTANLAKKPVDNYDEDDKKLLNELTTSQEKLDAFIQEKVTDFSKLAEQDMANSSLLKELMEVYSEVTMAKDALKAKATEIAVPLEESGLELAKEISSNLEKWLMDTPDRTKWTMEEPTQKQDVPMAELPKELEDMVGELMEDQEDIFEEMEDAASSWADSLDKGAGWDAMDGPIANMSAKGVTGNQNPNDMEMNGRSGEGRSGKSSGEMVEETASGKGGRNTPTRLDPTAFQKGEIKDESKDPVGGATGGGKTAGQGAAGLEGPLGPKMREEALKRLGQKQAELRNKAERLNLEQKVSKYDQFRLLEAIAIMRRVESDLKANRYENALRRKDVLLDRMDESKLMVGAETHVKHDTSPTVSQKMKEKLNDAMKGKLPAAWSEALKAYYTKLSGE